MLWFLLLFLLLSLWLLLLFLVFSLHSKRQPKRGGTMAAIFFFFSSCYCDGCCYFHVGLTREANFQLFFFYCCCCCCCCFLDGSSLNCQFIVDCDPRLYRFQSAVASPARLRVTSSGTRRRYRCHFDALAGRGGRTNHLALVKLSAKDWQLAASSSTGIIVAVLLVVVLVVLVVVVVVVVVEELEMGGETEGRVELISLKTSRVDDGKHLKVVEGV